MKVILTRKSPVMPWTQWYGVESVEALMAVMAATGNYPTQLEVMEVELTRKALLKTVVGELTMDELDIEPIVTEPQPEEIIP